VIARTGARVDRHRCEPAHVVETINRGEIHIEEANLDALVHQVVTSGHLDRRRGSAEPCDVFVIAVPTPFDDEHRPGYQLCSESGGRRRSLRCSSAATSSFSNRLRPSAPPNSCATCLRRRAPRPQLSAGLGRCGRRLPSPTVPERVLPGKILFELVDNDRSIGGISAHLRRACGRPSTNAISSRARASSPPPAPPRCASWSRTRSATSTSPSPTNLSIVSDTLKLDVWEVIRLANRHPRVNILQPGPGVGGHCIAVDPWFIVHSDPANARLIRTAREVNDGKIHYSFDRAAALAESAPGAKIACLGLAFKPNIDDLRESPALRVAQLLAERFGERVRLVEPHIDTLPRAFEETGAQLAPLDAALAECDVLVLLVDHDAFKAVSPAQRAGKLVHDSRGIWTEARAVISTGG
jgi:UDP-N-acetyl-D-mannosaminuronic acid dehydrogenase